MSYSLLHTALHFSQQKSLSLQKAQRFKVLAERDLKAQLFRSPHAVSSSGLTIYKSPNANS